MPPRLPDTAVEQIRRLLEAGYSDRAIHRELQASRPAISRIRKTISLFGEPYPPRTVVHGRPRDLSAYLEEVGVSKRLQSLTNSQ